MFNTYIQIQPCINIQVKWNIKHCTQNHPVVLHFYDKIVWRGLIIVRILWRLFLNRNFNRALVEIQSKSFSALLGNFRDIRYKDVYSRRLFSRQKFVKHVACWFTWNFWIVLLRLLTYILFSWITLSHAQFNL